MQVSTVGLDIAKNVFQLHGVDNHGRAVLRRKVGRSQLLQLFAGLEPCLIGMEACATAHHWARELGALGHEVRLMPPAYVKAYVKRNKNDAADAEAICEAVTRPSMRFVPVKSGEAQSLLMLHRARHLLVRQRTAQVSAMRAHLAEYGVVAARGISRLRDLLPVLDTDAGVIPDLASQTLLLIAELVRRSRFRFARSTPSCCVGTGPTPSASGSKPSPGSASSRRPRLRPPCAMHRCSDPDGSSPPGSGWCRGETPAAARTGWAGSPRWATAICATCW